MTHDHHLLTEPIPKLLRALAIPAAIGFFFNTMYNVVDTWIAGQISPESLASLSISFPVFFIIIAVSAGIGTGVTALMSNQLGADDEIGARQYAAQAISYGIIMSLLLSVVGYLASPFLFKILGAEGDYLATALSYMQPIFFGSIFLSMTFILNGLLNAIGDTKAFRNVLILGFFLNLLFSPWFAFGWLGFPALGVMGIALATVGTNAIGVIYLAYRVYQKEILSLADLREHTYPIRKFFWDITEQGLPASLSMMTIALGSFIITYFISTFGSAAVAGYGAALRVEQIVLIPGIGINTAVLTLIGQNNGAKKYDRVKEIVKVGLHYSLIIATVASLLIFTAGGFVMNFFSDDIAVLTFGKEYLYVAGLMTWAYGIIFVTDSVLRGLKRPAFPFVLGLLRQVILPIPLFYIFVVVLQYHITAMWWSIFGIIWSATILSLLYMHYHVGKKCQ